MNEQLAKINDVAEVAVNVAWPIILILIPILVSVVWKSMKTKEAKETFSSAIDTAYLVVSQMARKTETKIDDKVGEALKIVSDLIGRELTEPEKKAASSELKAKHEVTKFPDLLNIKKVGGFVGKLLNFKK